MTRTITVSTESYPIAGQFTIARGSKTEAVVVTCRIGDGKASGIGECVPYARYGETPQSVAAAIEGIRGALEDGADRDSLATLLPAGAARNAVDCALWDLEAKQSGTPASERVCPNPPAALTTAVTISIGSADDMADKARRLSGHPLLKVKVGTDDDEARIRAVAANAPDSTLILDANEGWNRHNLRHHMTVAAQCHVQLIEQPLPAGDDAILGEIPRPVIVCADESVHTADDLDALTGKYDAVNIKLDKAGGLTAALKLRDAARKQGFAIMVGCMVGTSLSMAPAVLLAQDADYVDLDGPLLLARDREPALQYEGALVLPPRREVWG